MYRLCLGGLILGVAGSLAGCRRNAGSEQALIIASPWPLTERKEVERAFQRWLVEQAHEATGGKAIPIQWLPLGRGDDLARVVRPARRRWDLRREGADVLLGGPISRYRPLDRAGQLAPVEPSASHAWQVARRSPIGSLVHPERSSAEDSSGERALATNPSENQVSPPLVFDDPRHDPIALAWADGVLNDSTWEEGYAKLVELAANPRKIGRQPGSALAAVERGEATATPGVHPTMEDTEKTTDPARNLTQFRQGPRASEFVEGVAIAQTTARPKGARLFLTFLRESGRCQPARAEEYETPDTDSLLADLLGATLVDAQEELQAAWVALQGAKDPARARMWLTQPPPWPPASVVKLEQEDATPLIQTLAGEIVPDPAQRAWLIRSWLESNRRVDRQLLEELALARDGKLALEPRFRAWLRAEWTAWARQRYRRVTRTVNAEGSNS